MNKKMNKKQIEKVRKKLKRVNYPKGFFSFHLGVPISRIQTNEWIKECVEKVLEGKDSWSMSSGNTKVEAEEQDGYIQISVTDGYSEKNLDYE